jgi:hypothetical protein
MEKQGMNTQSSIGWTYAADKFFAGIGRRCRISRLVPITLLLIALLVNSFGVEYRAAPLPVPPQQVPSAGILRTFYVSPSGSDANPGTQVQPWRTFSYTASRLLAGEMAIFEDGTYIETKIAHFRNSGTVTNPIILQARNKHRAVIVYRGIPENDKIFIDQAQYVTIQDFDITQESIGTTYNDVLVACRAGADFCTVRGNKLHNSMSPVKAYKNAYSLFEDNTIYDSAIGVDSINSNKLVVRNNLIYNTREDGILIKGGSRSTKIYNNTIRARTWLNNGITLGGVTSNIADWIYDPNGYEGYNLSAFNNVVIAEVPGVIEHGLLLRGCSSCAFVHNVVIGAIYAFQTVKSAGIHR